MTNKTKQIIIDVVKSNAALKYREFCGLGNNVLYEEYAQVKERKGEDR